MSTIVNVTLPASVVQNLHVGDLLKNDDAQSRVFGRIVRISQKGIWKRLQIDTSDKEPRQDAD